MPIQSSYRIISKIKLAERILPVPRLQTSFSQTELMELALRGIDAQITELEQRKAELSAQLGRPAANNASTAAGNGGTPTKRRKRKMSAEGRANISAAMTARHAKARQEKAAREAAGKKGTGKKAKKRGKKAS